MNNPNSSTRWLLIRTQAIGDAGDNNTALKMEIQTLRNRIKDIYHQKFLWNNTNIGIDGKKQRKRKTLFENPSNQFSFVEVQENFARLTSPDDMLNLWHRTYNVTASMRDPFSTLTYHQNQQAKQNRISSVTHSHLRFSLKTKATIKFFIFQPIWESIETNEIEFDDNIMFSFRFERQNRYGDESRWTTNCRTNLARNSTVVSTCSRLCSTTNDKNLSETRFSWSTDSDSFDE